ncbi:MAG: Cell wall-associated protein, partial [archaeon GW2011_AR1]
LIPKISLVKLTGSWNENTVTWANKPNYVQLLEKELIYEGEPFWYEFDVTSTIQNWVNGEANYGFGLRTEENTVSAWIYSSDYPESSKRPILEIIYQ